MLVMDHCHISVDGLSDFSGKIRFLTDGVGMLWILGA